ncbi:MAG: hypothetical protein AAF958_17300 [Planctomycetota bacterium]
MSRGYTIDSGNERSDTANIAAIERYANTIALGDRELRRQVDGLGGDGGLPVPSVGAT